MSVKKIADIKAAESPKPIEVRVIKKWKPYIPGERRKPDQCFLFVDIHGDAIEAACEPQDESHFNSLLELQKCYRLNGYVTKPARPYMPIVPHQASMFLGRRLTAELIENYDIPTYYYSFATFDVLDSRKILPKQLIDFIGLVDHVSPILLRKGRRLRKVRIRDVTGNPLEVTLWEEKGNLISPETAVGKALVITATIVTQYELKQLESTVSTTVELNPNFPQLQSYIERFNNLPAAEEIEPILQTLTVAELIDKSKTATQRRGKFLCNARIITAHEYRGWFFVKCTGCGKNAYEQDDSFVCAHCLTPKELNFGYSLNTTIEDNTSTIEAAFFDDSLQNLLGDSCKSLVMSKKNKNPKIFPAEVQAIIGVPLTLTVNIKPDGSLGVDNAQIKSTTTTSSSSSHKSDTITPQTPNPKITAVKTTSTPLTPDLKAISGKRTLIEDTAAENIKKNKNVITEDK